MRKQDEIELFALIRANKGTPMAALVAAEQIVMHEKRLHAILDKWANKGWWNYGVTMRSGWLTDMAPWDLQP